jgi:glyoxylase-like metal-dependent hydrolase (beta-lactamase superfamily II)/ferredoxin
MALPNLRLAGNVPGDFFVDSSCIDCDLCRQIAPGTFKQSAEQSIVLHQPETEEDQLNALKALVTCPTASIGTPPKYPIDQAVACYPESIEDEVYFCGFASESSYGASSYLIVRPNGNVLVDSPRFAMPLVKRISEMGGIRKMFFTHIDDVADHAQWARQFNAERILHQTDAGRLKNEIENLLIEKDPVQLESDLLAIPTPGHTRGHTVLLHKDRFLFTGDHVWWSERYKSLYASNSVCWYSWKDQIDSMERLLEFSFEWVLPGHGRRIFLPADEMRKSLLSCIRRMKGSRRDD